jgi:hypothetical protein
MAVNEDQMVLTAKLVDQVSDKLKEIQKNMLATMAASKKAHEGAGEASQAYQKRIVALQDVLHKFHERQVKQHEENKRRMEDFAESAKNMISSGVMSTATEYAGRLGAIGLAAGVAYEGIKRMGEALENLGKKSISLQLMSGSANMSLVGFQRLEKAMTAGGLSKDAADQSLIGFGDFLQRWRERQASAINQVYNGPRNLDTYLTGTDKMSPEEAYQTLVARILSQRMSTADKALALGALNLPTGIASMSAEEWKKYNEESIATVTLEQANANKAAQDAKDRADLHVEKLKNRVITSATPIRKSFNELRGWLAEGANEALDHPEMLKRAVPSGALASPAYGLATGGFLGLLGTLLGGQDKEKAKETIKEGTKEGFLEGIQQWIFQNKVTEAEKFAHGLQPMAYHPGGEIGDIGGRIQGFRSGGGYNMLDQSIGGGGNAGRRGATPRALERGGGSELPTILPQGALPPSSMAVLDAIAHAEVVHPFKRNGERSGYGETVSNEHFNPDDYTGTHPYESGLYHYFQGRYGPSSASGRYQETLTTYRENVRKYGIAGMGRDAQDKRAFLKAAELYRNYGYWHGYPGATGDLAKDADKFGGDPQWWSNVTAPAIKHEWTSVPGGLEPNDKSRDWIANAVHDWRMGHDAATAQRGGAHLRDHIRHHLRQGFNSGGEMGHAKVSIDLNGFPRGTRTTASANGMFKEVSLRRGRSMPLASEDA